MKDPSTPLREQCHLERVVYSEPAPDDCPEVAVALEHLPAALAALEVCVPELPGEVCRGSADREGVECRSLGVEVAREGEERNERDGEASQDGTRALGEQQGGRLDAGVNVVFLVLQGGISA